MASLLIFGGSRGLGATFSFGVPTKGDTMWIVSRGRPDPNGEDGVRRLWIEADLTTRGAGDAVARAIGQAAIDVVIYNAGMWEHNAFRPSYDFAAVDDVETERIIAVNLTAAVTSIRAVLPNLRRSAAAKVIFIGSTSGLDNAGVREVAYSASTFGLRGAAHALRETLRHDGIAVSCLNPGNIGTINVENGQVTSGPHEERRMIPPQDLVELVKCIIRLSPDSCVKEIDVMAMTDSI